MAVVRGFYKRYYGPEAEIGDINTALLRITEMYYSTDTGIIFWWTGTAWNEFGTAP